MNRAQLMIGHDVGVPTTMASVLEKIAFDYLSMFICG